MKINTLPISMQQVSIVIMIAILAIFAFTAEVYMGEVITEFFVFHREMINQGELWRIFTGHLLHTNGYHLLLNLSALVLLWALHGQFYTIKNYSALFLFCSFSTSVGVFFDDVSLIQYVGLSGVLHGIFVFGSMMDIAMKDKTGYLLFIGVWLKIAHEQIYGASSDVSELIEAGVAVDAHLWGAVGGFVFSTVYLVKKASNNT